MDSLPDIESDDNSKLANLLRNLQVGGMAMDVGKAGTMYQGRMGYQFDPNQAGNNFSVGASGQGFADNRYNIPSKITGVDIGYGGPDQSVRVGYYPNKSQFMGQPMGAGGFSFMYNKSFD
jgi:hypothetical protein